MNEDSKFLPITKLTGHTVILNGIDDNSIIFDCGGYKGMFTKQLMAHCEPTVHIYEPLMSIPHVALDEEDDLDYVFKDYDNITVHSNAVFNKVGKYIFFVSDNIKGSTLLRDMSNKYIAAVPVPTTTIEDEMVSLGIDKIDILKLDVEGSELSIIKFLPLDILNRISQICIEYHPWHNIKNYTKPLIDNCRKHIRDNGFIEINRGYKNCCYLNKRIFGELDINRIHKYVDKLDSMKKSAKISSNKDSKRYSHSPIIYTPLKKV